mmetsp:Transcript_19843/g.41734  ORF Transcript_19843/g.41734 Transcript_19843/m.41734 type:complete len:288 (-) Transcript_19843:177-1040(-)|eukprot:CAMPEP_0182527268 /NCGR_PEP_ID=MMETSP1323-20130603/3732_1 /TAXON_ID=236787 /ORGANISM="Florenciella parvula, Strain RCC1693" /LENGTH=287 /DNA_ID=CAMNT_0024736233 /DNA_START=104 /DNA_END=967 /DNA_ORIENTATION=-
MAHVALAVDSSSKSIRRPTEGFAATTVRSAGLLIGVLFSVVILSIRTVPPAHVGLIVTFGSVSEAQLGAGLHFVSPWAKVVVFNTKTQLTYSENIVPTQEGMNVELDVSLLFHPEPNEIRSLYLSVGEEYERVVIAPELQSAVRGLTSEVSAKALYTSGRSEIRAKLLSELQAKLKPRGIVLEDVLLKGIKLPTILTDAIESKAKAEQESQRMEFILSKEKQEATRKQIEAEGIAKFQTIVSEGISDQLLSWKGIEATTLLAASENSKVIVVGNSKDSLPVLLSNQA